MLRRLWRRVLHGPAGARARTGKTKPYPRIVAASADGWSNARPRLFREEGKARKEYVVALPDGYGARTVSVRLSVPAMPRWRSHAFAEHPTRSDGSASDTVVSRTTGGFAVSTDLGRSWRSVAVEGYRRRPFIQVKMLANDLFLAQAEPLRESHNRPFSVDLLTVDASGRILAASRNLSVPWHGCRAVDARGGVIMFAEYTPNPGKVDRVSSRVFRSRDGGNTWHVVFEQTAQQVRHFHFLQARRESAEWWLTSGDAPDECHIWVSRDNGDTWRDITEGLGSDKIRCGTEKFSRDLFRLTDIAWDGNDVIWGSDDLLWDIRNGEPGARIFASRAGDAVSPMPVGRGRWHFRSIVDVGEFYLAISQGCPEPDAVMPVDARPGVYLMRKGATAQELPAVHLIDVDTYSAHRTGFTYASASRVAKEGTFFSYRAPTDAFPRGNRILKWEVAFA